MGWKQFNTIYRQCYNTAMPTEKITLIAICTAGLEKMVKVELRDLGFENQQGGEGFVEFEATLADIPRANLWLRTADRVLLKLGEFEATTFDDLFEQTKALPWEQWIPRDGEFPVIGKSRKSQLGSIRACQSIVKKAVVERLKEQYGVDWFAETGPQFTIQVALLNDVAQLTLDTSGSGLHRRGYRLEAGEAPLKETLAAGLVMLSFWKWGRRLIDPMCGSGTILIEAALMGRNIAPGLQREFASEQWSRVPPEAWATARAEAQAAVLPSDPDNIQIFGYDIDEASIRMARANAERAGVVEDIHFETKPIDDLWIDHQYGIVISNPPYGRRLAEFQEMNQIYLTLHRMFRKKSGWSIYILTADKKFPDFFKRARPSRVRKLYNGAIEVQYYQYYGERPPLPDEATAG